MSATQTQLTSGTQKTQANSGLSKGASANCVPSIGTGNGSSNGSSGSGDKGGK